MALAPRELKGAATQAEGNTVFLPGTSFTGDGLQRVEPSRVGLGLSTGGCERCWHPPNTAAGRTLTHAATPGYGVRAAATIRNQPGAKAAVPGVPQKWTCPMHSKRGGSSSRARPGPAASGTGQPRCPGASAWTPGAPRRSSEGGGQSRSTPPHSPPHPKGPSRAPLLRRGRGRIVPLTISPLWRCAPGPRLSSEPPSRLRDPTRTATLRRRRRPGTA